MRAFRASHVFRVITAELSPRVKSRSSRRERVDVRTNRSSAVTGGSPATPLREAKRPLDAESWVAANRRLLVGHWAIGLWYQPPYSPDMRFASSGAGCSDMTATVRSAGSAASGFTTRHGSALCPGNRTFAQ